MLLTGSLCSPDGACPTDLLFTPLCGRSSTWHAATKPCRKGHDYIWYVTGPPGYGVWAEVDYGTGRGKTRKIAEFHETLKHDTVKDVVFRYPRAASGQ